MPIKYTNSVSKQKTKLCNTEKLELERAALE